MQHHSNPSLYLWNSELINISTILRISESANHFHHEINAITSIVKTKKDMSARVFPSLVLALSQKMVAISSQFYFYYYIITFLVMYQLLVQVLFWRDQVYHGLLT